MAEDLGEKTEEATPKRRQESREEGTVTRSQDLSGALLLLVATVAMAILAMRMLGDAKLALLAALDDQTIGSPIRQEDAWTVVLHAGAQGLRIVAPILIALWLAAYLAQFSQIGWLLAPKGLQPKLSKLDPIKGFQRVFGLSSLVKAGLDSSKVAVVLVVASWTILADKDRILRLPQLTVLQCLVEAGWMMFGLAMRVVLVLLLLGVLDYMYQRWKTSRDLRMTKQQVKDELKQTDGDPETKRRRMRMQQQIAAQRIAAAVPKADVIVTNPEHISIAIQYDADTMLAPKVIAKGADYLAMRIRTLAMQHGVPIVERKPLARALYREVAVGQEIPPAFFQAVAEILAYVYRLSGRMAG